MVVRCTNCDGQLVVPEPDTGEPSLDPPDPAGPQPAAEVPAPRLFERSDFDELLRPFQDVPGPVGAVAPPLPSSLRLSKPDDTVRDRNSAALVLSQSLLTVVIIAAVLALGTAFAAGLFVGMGLR